jgi:hypothetical protein
MSEGPTSRVRAIDSLRGLLMCVIILSHWATCLNQEVLQWPAALFVDTVQIFGGTPGFCLVSGMLLGYFIVTRADLSRIVSRYRRRGVQLLLIAHPLIALALIGPLGTGGSFADFLVRRWYITDNLALFLILGPLLLPRIGPGARLLIGLAMLPVSKLAYVALAPATAPAMVIHEVMLGVNPLREHILMSTYGLGPTAGYFLIGSFLGHRLGQAGRSNEVPLYLYRLRRAILPLLAISALMIAGWLVLKLDLVGSGNGLVQQMLYPHRTFSLFPAYLAAFLAAMVLLVRGGYPGAGGRVDQAVLIFGQASLFTYVVQYVIVQTIPWWLGWWGGLTLSQGLLLLAASYPLLLLLAAGYLALAQRKRRPQALPDGGGLAATSAIPAEPGPGSQAGSCDGQENAGGMPAAPGH